MVSNPIISPYIDFSSKFASAQPETALQAVDWKNNDYWLNEMKSRADRGDDAAAEKLFNYFASEESAKTARDWTSEREDNQYQRLMVDLQKAGISPYILSGATPGVSSASPVSHSGSQMTSRESNQRNASADILSKLITFAGTALTALAILL